VRDLEGFWGQMVDFGQNRVFYPFFVILDPYLRSRVCVRRPKTPPRISPRFDPLVRIRVILGPSWPGRGAGFGGVLGQMVDFGQNRVFYPFSSFWTISEVWPKGKTIQWHFVLSGHRAHPRASLCKWPK